VMDELGNLEIGGGNAYRGTNHLAIFVNAQDEESNRPVTISLGE
jgi:hypothetical protein